MRFLSVVLLVAALALETSLTTIPFVLLVLLIITSMFKDNFVFILAFIFGILLDLMTLRTVASSSIFFEIYVFLILMYQSKFEITTNNFIIVASFLGSACYLLIFGLISHIVLEPIVSTIFGLMMFIVVKRLIGPKTSNE